MGRPLIIIIFCWHLDHWAKLQKAPRSIIGNECLKVDSTWSKGIKTKKQKTKQGGHAIAWVAFEKSNPEHGNAK